MSAASYTIFVMGEDDQPLHPHRRMKRILHRDRQQIVDSAHADILKVVTEEGTDDEKIEKMNSLADIAYRLTKRVLKIDLNEKPKK